MHSYAIMWIQHVSFFLIIEVTVPWYMLNKQERVAPSFVLSSWKCEANVSHIRLLSKHLCCVSD